MKYLFLAYNKCSTCRNAQKWLDVNNIDYDERAIVDDNPTESELKEWITRSGLPVKSFFNTSGLVYKELQLKDKLPLMTTDEQIKLLAGNGKLVKRPLLIGNNKVLVGFKSDEWEKQMEK